MNDGRKPMMVWYPVHVISIHIPFWKEEHFDSEEAAEASWKDPLFLNHVPSELIWHVFSPPNKHKPVCSMSQGLVDPGIYKPELWQVVQEEEDVNLDEA